MVTGVTNRKHVSMEDVEKNLPPNEAKAVLNRRKIVKSLTNKGSNVNDSYLVFVYGSLLSGLSNNKLLETAKRIEGVYLTKNRYKMVDYFRFPAVCKAPKTLDYEEPTKQVEARSTYRKVIGEIYKIDRETLEDLDHLEGSGTFYQRELVDIEGYPSKVWMYILVYVDSESPLVTLNLDRVYDWRLHSEIQRKNFLVDKDTGKQDGKK